MHMLHITEEGLVLPIMIKDISSCHRNSTEKKIYVYVSKCVCCNVMYNLLLMLLQYCVREFIQSSSYKDIYIFFNLFFSQQEVILAL